MRSTDSSLSIIHALAPAHVGGLESVVLALAAGQRDAGMRITVVPVLAEDPKGHPFCSALDDRGIDSVALHVGVRSYREERRAIREVLVRAEADILHTHGYRSDVVDGSVAPGVGVGRVTTVHGYTGGGLKNRAYEWVQRRAIRRFDAVIAVSEKLRSDLASVGVPESRLHKVLNAWEATERATDRAAARAALNLDAASPVVGWVGRFGREKGPDQIVRALARSETPGLTLSMIGAGPMEKEVRALADELGVSDAVRWHGVVQSAATYMRAFDIVALSSWTEGTPIVLLEAMSAGVPVVATAVGGVPDLVGTDGLLVSAGDPGAMGRAIDRTLRDPEGARSRADAAMARLARDFSVGPWVSRHREIYEGVRRDASRGQ